MGGGKYFIWCSAEARKALEDYFQYRERYGEKIGPNSPVFRNDFDTDIIESARRVKSLSSDAMRIDIYEHLVKAGLRIVDHVNINNRNEVGMTKGFRKFFKTQLVLAGVDPELRELFIGHSQKKLKHVYTCMNEEQIFEEYSKAIPLLTIDPKNKLEKKVEELTEQNNKTVVKELEHRRTVQMLIEENNKTKHEILELRQRSLSIQEFDKLKQISAMLDQYEERSCLEEEGRIPKIGANPEFIKQMEKFEKKTNKKSDRKAMRNLLGLKLLSEE